MSWMIITSMVVLALLALVLVVVFGARQQAQRHTRLDVNRELYEQRRQELAQEHAEGLLTDKALSAAEHELDKRFISENTELEQLQERAIGSGIWLPAFIIVGLGIIGYVLFGSWQQQSYAEQARQALPQLAEKVISNQQAAPTAEELRLFALGLRQRLQEDGGDALAWMLYARAAAALQRYEEALAAYERAYQMDNERPAVLLGYAQLLINVGGAERLQQAAQLLSKLLRVDPQNTDALSLTGAVAYQLGDWQQAVQAWSILLQVMPEDDSRYAAVQTALADAEQRLAGTQQELVVTVALADELREQVPEQATLFVFVKAPDGAPMPAAVVRQAVTEFPVEVRLSDANAMLPDYKMSQLSQWQVEARISTDDRIEISAGDLGTAAQTIAAEPDASVTLTIDQILEPSSRQD
ncbi:c-type cytochrome biogenesis protein CcmI [Pseudidiomarina sp. 1APP75-27a]|uniref:c-type cytochrome biogenesis protein CcmI n=1 Tax=Pseudidiomarina terrestris TaxID=2820060 RepID=UPI00264DFA23|nr:MULTISPECIES: c-type cytochrome biogenesis protein CcmI [unclassified Pseudidiomarina]MDN7126835.1 c-type cytochrome biogenesis protein CcmI [Pseudidiomarina sp. 1APR75-33.1]MEA3587566.1 c-type cytochrome biogenesis protein CcmI [Pseudidiomarina sp. 1APP75-27a]